MAGSRIYSGDGGNTQTQQGDAGQTPKGVSTIGGARNTPHDKQEQPANSSPSSNAIQSFRNEPGVLGPPVQTSDKGIRTNDSVGMPPKEEAANNLRREAWSDYTSKQSDYDAATKSRELITKESLGNSLKAENASLPLLPESKNETSAKVNTTTVAPDVSIARPQGEGFHQSTAALLSNNQSKSEKFEQLDRSPSVPELSKKPEWLDSQIQASAIASSTKDQTKGLTAQYSQESARITKPSSQLSADLPNQLQRSSVDPTIGQPLKLQNNSFSHDSNKPDLPTTKSDSRTEISNSPRADFKPSTQTDLLTNPKPLLPPVTIEHSPSRQLPIDHKDVKDILPTAPHTSKPTDSSVGFC